jgi:toxin secretion/phage lysis holin
MNGQSILNGSVGVAGAIFTFAFGHWTEALTFLLCAIAADIISGTSASIKEGRGLNSAIGSAGLAKKGLMLLVIVLAHRMDVLLATDSTVMGAAIYFYIANELVSLTENYGRHGLPLPDGVKRVITVLKSKGGVEDGSSNGK